MGGLPSKSSGVLEILTSHLSLCEGTEPQADPRQAIIQYDADIPRLFLLRVHDSRFGLNQE